MKTSSHAGVSDTWPLFTMPSGRASIKGLGLTLVSFIKSCLALTLNLYKLMYPFLLTLRFTAPVRSTGA